MKLMEALTNIGTSLIREVPGGSVILDVVNAVLPDDQKLDGSASAKQIKDVIETLPPQEQMALFNKRIDLQIAEVEQAHTSVQTMLIEDAKNPHTTRPYVVKQSFHVLAFICISLMSAWLIAVLGNNEKIVQAIMAGWPFVLSVIGPFISLLYAYFGILKKESKDRYDAANQTASTPSFMGVLAGKLFNK